MPRKLSIEVPDDEELRYLNGQIATLFQNNQYVQSITFAKQICEIYTTRYAEEIHTKYSAMYALSLNNLAYIYQEVYDNLKAESVYLEKMKFLTDVVGEDSPDYAYTLADLALLYYNIGQENKSKALYSKAIEILNNVEEKNDQAYEIIVNHYRTKFQD